MRERMMELATHCRDPIIAPEYTRLVMFLFECSFLSRIIFINLCCNEKESFCSVFRSKMIAKNGQNPFTQYVYI